MRRVLLTGLLLLAVALGVAGGYYTGDRLDQPLPTPSGEAAPLGQLPPPTTTTPTAPPLPVKTPVPSDVPPLETGLQYQRRSFTVTPSGQSVDLSIKVPSGWKLRRDTKSTSEVRFLDELEERAVRVESDEPAALTPKAARASLLIGLRQSQPPENNLQIVSQPTGKVTGDDGEIRSVATLIYTYIPKQTTRYVIVRWIAMPGSDLVSVEMSITGLPQDAPALQEILKTATESVSETS
ncbi:hypothetical protein [Kribbella sp. NPDC055071]